MSEKGIAPGLSVIGYGIWSALGPDGPSTIAGIRGQIIGSETGNLWDPTVGANLNCFRVAAHQWWEGPTFLPDLASALSIRPTHASCSSAARCSSSPTLAFAIDGMISSSDCQAPVRVYACSARRSTSG